MTRIPPKTHGGATKKNALGLLALIVLASPHPASAASPSSDWEFLTAEDGIVVSTRVEPGTKFPSFRGIGRIDASVWEVLAILNDVDQHRYWMHRCIESERLEQVDSTRAVLYNRTDAPWPVADRDAVLASEFRVTNAGREIWAKVHDTEHSKAPLVDGVIRMPTLTGHYHLVAVDDEHSLIEYRVNADPGGRLPEWLVAQVSRDMPLITIENLRHRSKVVKDLYDVEALRRSNGG